MKRSFYLIFGMFFVLGAITFVLSVYDGIWGAAVVAAAWSVAIYDIIADSRLYKAKKTA